MIDIKGTIRYGHNPSDEEVQFIIKCPKDKQYECYKQIIEGQELLEIIKHEGL